MPIYISRLFDIFQNSTILQIDLTLLFVVMTFRKGVRAIQLVTGKTSKSYFISVIFFSLFMFIYTPCIYQINTNNVQEKN